MFCYLVVKFVSRNTQSDTISKRIGDLLQYDLFYTVQAANSKIIQASIENHLEYEGPQ